ncbi:MAG: hypothetical protein FJ290_27800 [Planctomycetes bacterium]|nr:hypothetical protein [Planctomycetota bacterium]
MTNANGRGMALRDAAEILALGLVLLAPQLALRDVWGPDETRFAEVAREMAARGDYLVPHLNGAIYAEKPPLHFWFAAALRPLFGADAGRVVSLLAALASLALIYRIGRRLYGRPEGLWAARIAATMLLFLGLGSAGILDSLLLTTILATIACGLAALDVQGPRPGACVSPVGGASAPRALPCAQRGAGTPRPQTQAPSPLPSSVGGASAPRALPCAQRGAGTPRPQTQAWWLGAYASAAAAVLTKGPIGLAIPAVVLLACALACRRQVRAGGWWHLAGALLMLALIAAWVVPACLKGGEAYARKILLQQTLERVSGSAAVHGEPPHYYLLRWPMYLWPWSLLVPLAIAAALRAAWRSGAWRAAWPTLWFLAVFVLLSCISGKGERYFLPAVPAAALACAHYLVSEKPFPRWHRGLLAATWLTVLAPGGLAVAMAFNAFKGALSKNAAAAEMLRDASTPANAAGAMALGVGLMAAGLLAFFWLRRAVSARRHAGMLAAVVVAISLGFSLLALPTINRLKSDRLAVAHFRPYLDQAEELYLFRTEFDGILNLYLARDCIPLLEATEQAARRLASTRRAAIALWKSQVEKVDPAARFSVISAGAQSPRNLVLLLNWKPDSLPSAEQFQR